MNITKQQKQLFWICLILLVAAYLYHSVVISVQRYAYYQRQARIAQMRAKARAKAAAAKPQAAPITSPGPVATTAPQVHAIAAVPVVPARSKLNGIWQGRLALQDRGICLLKLELREKEPGDFAGYSSLTCASVTPLMSAKDRGNTRTALVNQMDPDSAILSGTLQDGAIHFHVDKTIGTDINGCVVTSFTATQFDSGLATEWESGSCQGGHVILSKVHP